MLIPVSAPQQISMTLVRQTSHNAYWTCIAMLACVFERGICVRIDTTATHKACLQTRRVLCTHLVMQQG